MTYEEMVQLMKIGTSMYPNYFKAYRPEDLQVMSRAWFYHFKGYPAEVVNKAYMAAQAVCKFPPTPADVFEQLQKSEQSVSPAQQWAQLMEVMPAVAACENYRRYPVIVGEDANGNLIKDDGRKRLAEIYNSLPKRTQEFVGSIAGLVDMASTGKDELHYVQQRFERQVMAARETLDYENRFALGGGTSPQIGW